MLGYPASGLIEDRPRFKSLKTPMNCMQETFGNSLLPGWINVANQWPPGQERDTLRALIQLLCLLWLLAHCHDKLAPPTSGEREDLYLLPIKCETVQYCQSQMCHTENAVSRGRSFNHLQQPRPEKWVDIKQKQQKCICKAICSGHFVSFMLGRKRYCCSMLQT